MEVTQRLRCQVIPKMITVQRPTGILQGVLWFRPLRSWWFRRWFVGADGWSGASFHNTIPILQNREDSSDKTIGGRLVVPNLTDLFFTGERKREEPLDSAIDLKWMDRGVALGSAIDDSVQSLAYLEPSDREFILSVNVRRHCSLDSANYLLNSERIARVKYKLSSLVPTQFLFKIYDIIMITWALTSKFCPKSSGNPWWPVPIRSKYEKKICYKHLVDVFHRCYELAQYRYLPDGLNRNNRTSKG